MIFILSRFRHEITVINKTVGTTTGTLRGLSKIIFLDDMRHLGACACIKGRERRRVTLGNKPVTLFQYRRRRGRIFLYFHSIKRLSMLLYSRYARARNIECLERITIEASNTSNLSSIIINLFSVTQYLADMQNAYTIKY